MLEALDNLDEEGRAGQREHNQDEKEERQQVGEREGRPGLEVLLLVAVVVSLGEGLHPEVLPLDLLEDARVDHEVEDVVAAGEDGVVDAHVVAAGEHADVQGLRGVEHVPVCGEGGQLN